MRILHGDCRAILPTLDAGSVHCCVTSPPYFGLRDYGVDGQIGLEATPDAYIAELVAVFREVRRVLRDDGTLWLNLGDSYAGSGKGGNPDAGKQATNKGSQTIGVLYGKTGETARQAAVTNITRKTWEIGAKPKDLLMIPARVALALQADGWWLRSDIIWHKPNPMPESVTDRPTSAHEHIFLLSKSERYWYDAEAVAEPMIYTGLTGQDASGYKDAAKFNGKHAATGKAATSPRNDGNSWNENNGRGFIPTRATRNLRNVWTIATKPFSEAHFATFPPELAERCIKAGCPKDGTVIDPFGGAGTTGLVADRLQRNAVLIELNPAYRDMAHRRIADDAGLFAKVAE